jgi:hypothetical protein
MGFTNVVIWENVVFSNPIATGSFKADGWLQANGQLFYNYYLFEVSADNMAGNETKARTLIYHYKDAKSFLISVF